MLAPFPVDPVVLALGRALAISLWSRGAQKGGTVCLLGGGNGAGKSEVIWKSPALCCFALWERKGKAYYFNDENYQQYSDEELRGGQGEVGEEEVSGPQVVACVSPSLRGCAVSGSARSARTAQAEWKWNKTSTRGAGAQTQSRQVCWVGMRRHSSFKGSRRPIPSLAKGRCVVKALGLPTPV